MSRKPAPTGAEILHSVIPEAPVEAMFSESLPSRLTTEEDIEVVLLTTAKGVMDGQLNPERAKAAAPYLIKAVDMAAARIRRNRDAQEGARESALPALPPMLHRKLTLTEYAVPNDTRTVIPAMPDLPPEPRKLREPS